MNKLYTGTDGKQFWVSPQQAEAIESLSETQKGGVATIYGYSSSSGYITRPVEDKTIITRFSTEKLYKRRIAKLNEITLNDILPGVNKDEKLRNLSVAELETAFNERKASLIESMEKTLSGDRSDARREAHDRCYSTVSQGVKVHFVTEKVDGVTVPVLTDGFPTADSIMLSALELSKNVRVKGEKKPVNSGVPVRVGNLIEKCLNQRSVGFRSLSLKPDNFERLVISRRSFLPEDVEAVGADVLNG